MSERNGDYMRKYIDAEQAERILYEGCHTTDGREILSDVVELWHMIQCLPAADVRPVVRGKWQVYYTNLDNLYTRCTACLSEFAGEKDHYKLCPKCGAYMTEES